MHLNRSNSIQWLVSRLALHWQAWSACTAMLWPLSASWFKYNPNHMCQASVQQIQQSIRKVRQNDISVLLKSSKEGKPAGPDGPCRGKVVLAVLFTPEQCVHKTQSRTRAMWQCARARVPQIEINTPIEQGGKHIPHTSTSGKFNHKITCQIQMETGWVTHSCSHVLLRRQLGAASGRESLVSCQCSCEIMRNLCHDNCVNWTELKWCCFWFLLIYLDCLQRDWQLRQL